MGAEFPWPCSHAECWLAQGPQPDCSPLPRPYAVLTPGRAEVGEGTKLEEDNGIRGFVLWIWGWRDGQSLTPLSLSILATHPCPGIEMGASFLIEGRGKMSTGQAFTGRGGWEWQLNQSNNQGEGRDSGEAGLGATTYAPPQPLGLHPQLPTERGRYK